MPSRSSRLLAAALAVSLAASPATGLPADLNGQMQQMFDDLGALGNVTSPGAFRGQAMNLYTILANRAEDALGRDDNRIALVTNDAVRELPPADKTRLADQILDALVEMLAR